MPVLVIVVVIFFVVFRNIAAAHGAVAGGKAVRKAAPVRRPAPKRPQPQRRGFPEASHLCDDEESHRMTFGASGDDLTEEVAEMNRRNNTVKSRGPMRLRTMTAEDLAAKRRELKTLLEGGIIDQDEYRSILRDYENSRIF